MITYEALEKANERINKTPIKGKDYAMVNDRIKAFREICPGGSITTEIVSEGDGIITMRATVTDDEGHILGTGTAQEKETSSYINKTSYVENCETSAVGRALGFAGIGVDGSMASAEEVANAMLNQNREEKITKENVNKKISEEQYHEIEDLIEAAGVNREKLLEKMGVKSFKDLTKAQYQPLKKKLMDAMEDADR